MKKTTSILLFFILFIPENIKSQKQSNSVFCFACAECNKVIYFEQIGNDLWPNSFGCEKEIWHSWCNIGIYGNIKSQCKYCKIIVKTKFDPLGSIGTKKSCSVTKKEHYFIRIK